MYIYPQPPTVTTPKGSGKTELAASRSGETEPVASRSGKTEPVASRLDETKPATLGYKIWG